MYSPHIFGWHPGLLEMVQYLECLLIKLRPSLPLHQVSVGGQHPVAWWPLLLEICERAFEPQTGLVWILGHVEYSQAYLLFDHCKWRGEMIWSPVTAHVYLSRMEYSTCFGSHTWHGIMLSFGDVFTESHLCCLPGGPGQWLVDGLPFLMRPRVQ